MLVRHPSNRASIATILSDPWLGESPLPKVVSRKPLICEVNIPSEIHAVVLKKMENGKISTREQTEKYCEVFFVLNLVIVKFLGLNFF